MSDIIERQKKKFLDALPDTYDKTEGSVIVDLATANAVSNEYFYLEWERVEDSLDYRVATGDDLTTISTNFGIFRLTAIPSSGEVTVIGNSGVTIPKGFIFANDTTTYSTDYSILIPSGGSVKVNVTSTIEGLSSNTIENTIVKIPISLSGVTSVTNVLAFSNGADEESDEDLRERVEYAIRYPATSGNVNNYYLWAREVEGVGGARVIVKPTGAGSMRIAVSNDLNEVAPQTLLDDVEMNIRLKRPATSGTLEVVSITVLDIDIAVTGVTLDSSSGLDLADVLNNIISNLTEHVNDFSVDTIEVAYAGIVRVVVNTLGVANYENVSVNGGTDSIPITGNDLPKADTITAVA